MSSTHFSVDNRLEANPSTTLPVDVSYTGYEYNQLNVQSGNVANWVGGSSIVYESVQYENSVYDLPATMIEAKCQLYLNGTSSGTPAGANVPLSDKVTAALEKYFVSSLLENIQVQYGGTDMKGLEAPSNVFPHLHALYTSTQNQNNNNVGTAKNRYIGPSDAAFPATAALAKQRIGTEVITVGRKFDIEQDAQEPFNLCWEGGDAQVSGLGATFATTGFNLMPYDLVLNGPAAAGQLAYIPNLIYSNGHLYRSQLIINKSNAALGASTPNTINTLAGNVFYEVRFVARMYHPFFCNPYKKPANLKIRVSLRRSNDIAWSILGNVGVDLVVSSSIPLISEITSAKYVLVFSEIDMYMKRLILSESQMAVYREARLLTYDQDHWTAQLLNINSSNVSENISFVKTPEVIYVALMKNDSFAPSFDAAQVGLYRSKSIFDTAPRGDISFSNLYLNTGIGQIPRHEYRLVSASGTLDVAQAMRAYEEFKKTFLRPDSAPSFENWVNNYCWFAFIINSDNSNPNYVSANDSRSNATLRATVSLGAGAYSDYSIMVVGASRYQMNVENMKATSLIT